MDLERCLRVSEVRSIVLEGLVASVESVLATEAVPVGALDLFAALDRTHDVTVIAATNYFQPC